MKKTIVIILAVILTDCFLFCQPSSRFMKYPEAWASQYIQDTTVFIGVAEYTDPIASHILAITDAVQKYLAKRSAASVSAEDHVNYFEPERESNFKSYYDVKFGYDVLDILVYESERYFVAVKFDDSGRYNVVKRISFKENGTIGTMDSHFIMSGADKAEGYVINVNSTDKTVDSNDHLTGQSNIEIKYTQKC